MAQGAVSSATIRELNRQFSGLFQDAYKATPTYTDQLAFRASSSTSENVYGFMADLDNMEEFVGPRTLQRIGAHSYTLKNKKFQASIAVSADDIKDDNLGVYSPRAARLGEVARRHPWQLLIDVLLANPTGYDGVSFFNDAHPVDAQNPAEGTTDQGNLLTSTSLTKANVFQARRRMMRFKSESGTPMGIIGDTLMVAPEQEETVLEIAKAATINVVSGSNTAASAPVNVAATLGLNVIVEPRLADGTWYMFHTKSIIKPFVYQVREEPTLVQKTDASSDHVHMLDEYVWSVTGRYNVGVGPWFHAIKCTA